MNNVELMNKVISYLDRKARRCTNFPREYSAKEIADSVGGYPPAIGKVADDVLAELRGRGIKVKYVKTANPRRFVIDKGINC